MPRRGSKKTCPTPIGITTSDTLTETPPVSVIFFIVNYQHHQATEKLTITRLTAARPERSNARAERVARSRGVQRSATLGIMPPIVMRLKDAKIDFQGDNIRVLQTLFF